MDTQQITNFFNLILPTEGFYCGVFPELTEDGRSYFRHVVLKKVDDVVNFVINHTRLNHNVYYAVASLKSSHYINRHNGVDLKQIRVRQNILCVKSLYLDLDVGEGATKYPDKASALHSLYDFIEVINWPEPVIVDSGNGVHIYWPLSFNVEPEVFLPVINKLYVAASYAGLRADPACRDITRILRAPGSYNFKDPANPKEVRILNLPEETFDIEELESRLDEYIQRNNLAVLPLASDRHEVEMFDVPDYLDAVESNIYESEPRKLEKIAAECAVVADFIASGGHVEYPIWFHSLQLVRFCVDEEGVSGRDLCHKLSKNSDKYTPEATDKVVDGLIAKNVGPTRCERFSKLSPRCASCPHFGKIASPIVFGKDYEHSYTAPIIPIDAAPRLPDASIPPAPFPYTVTPRGVAKVTKTAEGHFVENVLCPLELVPVRRMQSYLDKTEFVVWRVRHPQDGIIELKIPATELTDSRGWFKHLANAGIYVLPENKQELYRYLMNYSMLLSSHTKKEIEYHRLGWYENTTMFVYQNNVYKPDGVEPCVIKQHGRLPAVKKCGSYKAWREILTYFEGPEFVRHQFAIGTAFGAPLLAFTSLKGGIINLVGVSGEGKSTIQKIVASVWGHPVDMLLPAETKASTLNAKFAFFNQMHSLPICAEEITNIDKVELDTLVYSVSQGTDKMRAEKSGALRDSQGGFCTIMLSSSNVSLYDKVSTSTGATAKTLRIIEYRLQKVGNMPYAEFSRKVDIPLLENYGHAGDIYLRYIMQFQQNIRSELMEQIWSLQNDYNLRPDERVWAGIIACNLVGLSIANKLGLCNFDMNNIRAFVTDLIDEMRDAVTEINKESDDAIGQFLADHYQHTVIVDQGSDRRPYVVQYPRGGLYVRYDKHEGMVHVMVSKLREWCRKRNLDYKAVKAAIKTEFDLAERRITLGAGLGIPSQRTIVLSFGVSKEIASARFSVLEGGKSDVEHA